MSETGLTNGDFTQANEPYSLFEAWLAEAAKSEPNDPNGMALATVRERLRLLHDVAAQCDVWREPTPDGEMFHARIVLPAP